MGKRLAKKVLVIGWDAADWKVINPLLQMGKMPTLKKFLEEASWGNISTLDPPLSPMLWTSIATGKRADQHGILGFIEPNAENNGVQPVTSTSRKCKAIWNILNQQGIKSNVVGWWPSHPAEPINGVMVSNFYQKATAPWGEDWEMAPGTVHPERLKDELAELRVHPAELTRAHIAPFVPNVAKLDLEKENRLMQVTKILAHCSSIHNASTHLMVEEPWEFMAVYHDAIDHFCHLCMRHHPPYREGVPKEDYENYKHVVTGGYLFHDMMLERILNLVDDDTTVIILSDHGFHSDHLRPMALPKEPAAPAHEHSPYGIFAIKGPNIHKGKQIFGASIIDVTPTLLALYGLPIGKDMEGKPLVECFTENPFLEYCESWEKIEGFDGRHDPNIQGDKWESQKAIDQLVELGYIDKPDEDSAKAVENARNESQFYLARNFIDAYKFDEAIPILEELIENDKNSSSRYYEKLAICYMSVNRFRDCEALLNKAKKTLEHYRNYLRILEGKMFAQSNRIARARKIFNELLEEYPEANSILVELAKLHHSKQEWAEAEVLYNRIAAKDPGHTIARHGNGLCKLRLDKPEEALEEFFAAVEQRYFYPQCHYHIGEALVNLKKYEEAAHAFEITLSMAPKMIRARKWLIDIYENHLKDETKASNHQSIVDNTTEGEIVIVSGLPRSGTSMMMQMIDKGGIEPLADELRQADKNNPKGYYEYEPVKRLAQDNSWMNLADGKSLKVIAQLLPSLPPKFKYKIVFMVREMNEVLQSQQIMLGRSKDKASKSYPVGLAKTYKDQVEKTHTWIDSQPNVDMLLVNYSDVINNPIEKAKEISGFLDQELNIEEMAKVVDPELYRNKLEKA